MFKTSTVSSLVKFDSLSLVCLLQIEGIKVNSSGLDSLDPWSMLLWNMFSILLSPNVKDDKAYS